MSPDGLSQRLVSRIETEHGWRAAWLWALLLVLALRVGLGLTMGAAWLAVKDDIPVSQLTDRAIYDGLPTYAVFPVDALLGVWQRWDAVHHLNLARVGYFAAPKGDTVFYPLYAILTRAVSYPFGKHYVIGGLIVSSAATTAALACLYRLVDRYHGSESARWSVLALAVYPTSFFLVAPFTESMFLALTLGAFLAALDRRWGLTGVLGALASLTRGPGLLTPLALGWIALRQWRETAVPARLRQLLRTGLGLVLPLMGGLSFQWWRARAGFAPMREVLHTYSGVEMTNPVRGLGLALAQLAVSQDLPVLLEVSSALLFLSLTVAMAISQRWRRGECLTYMIVNLGVFFSKHSLKASSLQSLARYVLVLFPGFIVVGDWLSRHEPVTRFIYLIISGLLLIVLSALYALWWFVG